MTTSTAATIAEVEVFRHQARTTRTVVRVNLEGITHEESLVQPQPAGNCLNWVLGHLLSVYNSALPLLQQEPVLPQSALALYVRGAPPLREPGAALPLGDLRAAWEQACERIDAGLAGLTPEVLDRPAPQSPAGDADETVRSLVSTILFHQAYHAGQLGVLRRIAGKPGAIA